MPAFCARWPDGSFRSSMPTMKLTHACSSMSLTEEPAELWPMHSCMLDFDLTDDERSA